ncbi:hypothetical protein ACMHYB_21375 [Sorangium sp. So ce1128]
MSTLKPIVFASFAVGSTLCPYAASANVPYMAPSKCEPLPITAQMISTAQAETDIERLISVDKLPGPVYATLMGLGQDIRVLQVEESIDENGATYEIDLVQNDTYYEVELDASGNVTVVEIEAWIVSLDSLTEPARRMFENEALGGAILEVRKEVEEDVGDVVYEADIRKDGRDYILRIDAHGGLIERDITLEMLPWGAYRALVCAAQGGSIVELDEELHDGQFSYEANIVLGEMEFELSVDRNGKVVELNL